MSFRSVMWHPTNSIIGSSRTHPFSSEESVIAMWVCWLLVWWFPDVECGFQCCTYNSMKTKIAIMKNPRLGRKTLFTGIPLFFTTPSKNHMGSTGCRVTEATMTATNDIYETSSSFVTLVQQHHVHQHLRRQVSDLNWWYRWRSSREQHEVSIVMEMHGK